jgi:hypothetical protein
MGAACRKTSASAPSVDVGRQHSSGSWTQPAGAAVVVDRHDSDRVVVVPSGQGFGTQTASLHTPLLSPPPPSEADLSRYNFVSEDVLNSRPASGSTAGQVRTVVIPKALLPKVRGNEVETSAPSSVSSSTPSYQQPVQDIIQSHGHARTPVCSHCGCRQIDEGAVFCPDCGHHIIGFDLGGHELSIGEHTRF